MNTSEHILVIILSVFLALLLLLSIAAVMAILRLLKTMNRITQKAEKVIDSAESVGSIFRNSAGPLAALRLLHNIVDSVGQHSKKHK